MKLKAQEDVQVSHEIVTQMFRVTKIESWHKAMMVLHMAHYGREVSLVCFGQAYACSSCKVSRRQHSDRKLGRAKTWLIKS